MNDTQYGGTKVRDIANLFGLCALAYTGRAVQLVASVRHPSATVVFDPDGEPAPTVHQ